MCLFLRGHIFQDKCQISGKCQIRTQSYSTLTETNAHRRCCYTLWYITVSKGCVWFFKKQFICFCFQKNGLNLFGMKSPLTCTWFSITPGNEFFFRFAPRAPVFNLLLRSKSVVRKVTKLEQNVPNLTEEKVCLTCFSVTVYKPWGPISVRFALRATC